VLGGLGNKPRRAYLLADPEKDLKVTSADARVVVRVPEKPLDPIATVVVVEIDGAPIVFKAPVLDAESAEFVSRIEVHLGDANPALDVRYTLDGSEPTKSAKRLSGSITLTESATVKARLFHDGKPVSATTERRFERITPAPAVEASPSEAGLLLERFAVDWDSIPDDRSALASTNTSVAASVGLAGVHDEHVALRFSGFLEVPEDELYRFALASDDGSKLWIDGKLVVDLDGLHGTVEKVGTAALAHGLHRIEVVWFNKTGGAELGLRWARPGARFDALPAAAFRH
jgi:hypothetical protein